VRSQFTLPDLPPVTALLRISPSRFTALSDCALRELLAASRNVPQLPQSPRAKLGQAAHVLIELAGKGTFRTKERSEIEAQWSNILASIETSMGANWLERALVPLKRSVSDYEVLRLRAVNKALAIAQRDFSGSREKPGPRVLFEQWVQTADGLVGGLIDEVYESPEGIVIRDYKSGFILDHSDIETAPIREEYVTQMHLYSALYKSSTGVWPSRLELIPTQGPGINVPFDPAECERLLESAVVLLNVINEAIYRLAGEGTTSLALKLANPKSESCRFCSFRPSCTAYRQNPRETDGLGPNDVCGAVIDILALGNGRVNLKLMTVNDQMVFVRGLDPRPERHPALSLLKLHDELAIFNLGVGPGTASFRETQLTTIYRSGRRVQLQP
jgi:hypothetical protein